MSNPHVDTIVEVLDQIAGDTDVDTIEVIATILSEMEGA